jgi:hypothetical protein
MDHLLQKFYGKNIKIGQNWKTETLRSNLPCETLERIQTYGVYYWAIMTPWPEKANIS